MNMGDKAILVKDVFSVFDKAKKKALGKRNEEVTIISTPLPAVIIENKKGERFSTHISSLIIKT